MVMGNKLLYVMIFGFLLFSLSISEVNASSSPNNKIKVTMTAYKDGIPYNGIVSFILWTLQTPTGASGVGGLGYNGSFTVNAPVTGQNYVSVQCYDPTVPIFTISNTQNYTIPNHPSMSIICNLP